jgi:hypothetical protein
MFFNMLIDEINMISGEIVGETWEWFARPTVQSIEAVTPKTETKTPTTDSGQTTKKNSLAAHRGSVGKSPKVVGLGRKISKSQIES